MFDVQFSLIPFSFCRTNTSMLASLDLKTNLLHKIFADFLKCYFDCTLFD